MTALDHLATVDRIIAEVVEPAAVEIDRTAAFPRGAVEAMAGAGLLGLISSTDVGGQGAGIRQAAEVVERLAESCASTAMVTCMHYAATAVIEAHGSEAVRREIAAGRHLSTLAFSEVGSRSHFWAPLSTVTPSAPGALMTATPSAPGSPGGRGPAVVLNAAKSWVTAAGEADSYVWSSRPLAGEGASTLWLVPAGTAGVKVAGGFDGLGLRGNASSPVSAVDAVIPEANRLGADGGGFEVMMGVVLPIFQVMNAGASVGLMETAVARTVAHVTATRYEHLDETLADQPIVRAGIARMRVRTDQARALWADTLSALEAGRDDAMLRVLEVKASANEAAVEVTELALRTCGGAAFRREVGVERFFRDARAGSVMAPTTDVLHDFIGRAVCGLPLF